jgi:hypothetical protein
LWKTVAGSRRDGKSGKKLAGKKLAVANEPLGVYTPARAQDAKIMVKMKRRLALGIIVLAIGVTSVRGGLAGQPQAAPRAAAAKPDSATPGGDPKCAFLKQELARLQNSSTATPDRIPASIRPLYSHYATEVNVNIVEGKIGSCEKGEKLSSLVRLRGLEAMRLQHIGRIRRQLQGAPADALVAAVNSLYEQEAGSFYNYESVGVPVIDRDVIKDYPTLLELVKLSRLPEELKTSFPRDFKFIKYEEAGHLQNGLLGIDKDLGNTLMYVLRADLAERSAADAERLREADRARVEQQKASEKREADAAQRIKSTARITLSVSILVVLALVGFLLIGREAVTFPVWLNVMEVAGLVLLAWVLIGMGLLTWLATYIGLAF